MPQGSAQGRNIPLAQGTARGLKTWEGRLLPGRAAQYTER